MRILDFLAVAGVAVFWYGAVPLAGSLVSRRHWKIFQKRFKEYFAQPPLNYKAWSELRQDNVRRFSGVFEALSDRVMWVKNNELTMPVNMNGASAYFCGDEAMERINCGKLASLPIGAKIFVAGEVVHQEGRLIFAASKKNPLVVIFYNGEDAELARQVISASRNKNDYWNKITPYALIMGMFSLMVIAIAFLDRPAFRFTVITAFIALFIPLFPFFPPGILLTLLYRFFAKQAREISLQRDLLDISDFLSEKEENPTYDGAYTLKAVLYKIAAWFSLLAAINANIVFITIIISIFIQHI